MSELLIHRLKLPLFIYDASPVLCPKLSPYSLLLLFFIVLEKALQAQNNVFNSFGFHAENLGYLLCCQSQGRLVIISKNTQVPVTLGKEKGEGWHEYKFRNPVTGFIEDKTAFVKRHGDYLFGSGTYAKE